MHPNANPIKQPRKRGMLRSTHLGGELPRHHLKCHIMVEHLGWWWENEKSVGNLKQKTGNGPGMNFRVLCMNTYVHVHDTFTQWFPLLQFPFPNIQLSYNCTFNTTGCRKSAYFVLRRGATIRSNSVHARKNQRVQFVQTDLDGCTPTQTRSNKPRRRGYVRSTHLGGEFPRHQTLSTIDQPEYEFPKKQSMEAPSLLTAATFLSRG